MGPAMHEAADIPTTGSGAQRVTGGAGSAPGPRCVVELMWIGVSR
jgi:hypothetical protein